MHDQFRRDQEVLDTLKITLEKKYRKEVTSLTKKNRTEYKGAFEDGEKFTLDAVTHDDNTVTFTLKIRFEAEMLTKKSESPTTTLLTPKN